MPSRSDRIERLFRGVLGLALLAGVAWALAHGASDGSHLVGSLH
jgi:phosphate/sulfate permease